MNKPHYVTETQTLRRVMRSPDCRFIWVAHAVEQMSQRQISAPDIESALTNGQIVLHEQKADILWRVDGKDIDGKRIKVLVAVNETENTIKVITAF